jgi:putative intracellular protease/amidase
MATVALLLYPGCIFFEVALAAETLAGAGARLRWYMPDGAPLTASNGARIAADGDLAALAHAPADAVLLPGGDPGGLLVPRDIASAALQAQAARGALMAGICAGGLLLAAAGLLRGRRGTHNYTAEHAPPEVVATVAPYWQGMRFECADLVEDGPVITAQPWAYRRYAATVARRLGLLDAAAAEALVRQPERAYARAP